MNKIFKYFRSTTSCYVSLLGLLFISGLVIAKGFSVIEGKTIVLSIITGFILVLVHTILIAMIQVYDAVCKPI